MAQYSVYRPWATRPFGSLDQLRSEMNDLFDRGLGRGAGLVQTSGVFPPVNLYETRDAYFLTAEIPGVEPDEIHVSLEDSTLTIQGERKLDAADYEEATPHRVERQAGSFRRAFSMPAKIDGDKVEAAHKNGVLMLRVPKSPEVQPRQITVQAS